MDPIKENWRPICTKIWAHIPFSEWIARGEARSAKIRSRLHVLYWKQAIHGGAAYVRRSVNADHRDVVIHGKLRYKGLNSFLSGLSTNIRVGSKCTRQTGEITRAKILFCLSTAALISGALSHAFFRQIAAIYESIHLCEKRPSLFDWGWRGGYCTYWPR